MQMIYRISEKVAKAIENKKLEMYLTQWGQDARSNPNPFIQCNCDVGDTWDGCSCLRLGKKKD
jgi:hypothetical protein